MNITAFDLAQRFVGVRELPGDKDNPFVMAMLTLDQGWPQHDEVPWCSAFVNFIAWMLRLPRSKSLGARSWLQVGTPVISSIATPRSDVIVVTRGANPAGPEVINAPGHVGFFAGWDNHGVAILGGNQGNSVGVAVFPAERILGVRRLE